MSNNCCPLCKSDQLRTVFYVKGMPVFPNMVFPTANIAKEAPAGDMTLTVCDDCGFVFNKTFDETLLHFDKKYDNEQKHSAYYQNYLRSIIQLLRDEVPHFQKIAEVGCGKGHFLEMLLQEGFEAIGYDPTYEGDNPAIVKDYFSEKYSTQNADLLVLRHMLYTVLNPFELLHTIAKANHYQGMIYIEVLDFEWISEQASFCDICYEQVVYFTKDTLASFFEKSNVGNIFGGQYIYLIADLADLRKTYLPSAKGGKHLQPKFEEKTAQYRKLAKENQPLMIWGAGGKGVSFTHLVHSAESPIACLIDINPNKQNQFIAPQGIAVYAPKKAFEEPDFEQHTIFVVNPNYVNEIQKTLPNTSPKVLTFE